MAEVGVRKDGRVQVKRVVIALDVGEVAGPRRHPRGARPGPAHMAASRKWRVA